MKSRTFWQFPWGYGESFTISTCLLIIGIMLQVIGRTSSMNLPSYPNNLYLLIAYCLYLLITFLLFRKSSVINWLSSVPAAISIISVYTFLVLMLGFVPQNKDLGFLTKIGFTHLQSSIPFLLVSLLLLTSLGYTILKRAFRKPDIRNTAFLLNHLGLFIILVAGSIGSSDLLRLTMELKKQSQSDIAVLDKEHAARLPFSIQLNDFIVEQYAPELLLFDKQTGLPATDSHGKYPFIEQGSSINIGNFSCKVLKYLEYAIPDSSGLAFREAQLFGATQAALIEVTHNNSTKTGWISNENFAFPPSFFNIDDNSVLGMGKPKVKKFTSLITIFDKEKTLVEQTALEVNKPLSCKGWKIYQHSYSGEMGRWSEVSILELIRDPWLPYVYTGIFMVLAGSLYLVWAGRSLKTTYLKEQENH